MPTKAERDAAVESALRLLTLRKASWAEQTLAAEVKALQGELEASRRLFEEQAKRELDSQLSLRALIALHRFGYTQDVVGHVFGWSTSTVQKRLKLARRTYPELCDPACEWCRTKPIVVTPCRECLSSLPLRRAK